ncbi:hypothetical protein NLJ89_g9642 [Agrocybe chaxingu]|uniref:Xylanolytic transcriptional activator regulatory domain-containing protein n=1 Tax=Agrocybe chaxingu TaxID=84603 RepID=A0A9W8JZL5_9AGAR|nr:hypothetical protein NLJ89_g9642 [Agrocybe chaxingu]
MSASSPVVAPHQPVTLQMLITHYLPPYAEATRLVQLYLEQAPWFFGAVTGRQLETEIIPLWYEESAHASSTATPPAGGLASSSSGSQDGAKSARRTGTSHDLALLFVVFCFGALTDTNLPAAPDNAPAERFYQLTKASLTLDPGVGIDAKSSRNGVLERPPSVATVQTLSLMAIYEGLCSGENSIESTWALMGLACKLSQSIGLHRDCARWKLTPAEVQKRRALFWELFITDCWQSLATGRLATFSLPFVDCELPFDPDQTIADDGTIQPSFPFWKARFGAECVAAVVQGTLTSRAPKYSIILDLDRKVRDMELPSYAQGPVPQGLGLAQTMSHFMPVNYRELTLLYIHRCFFAHAISSNPLDPIKSPYAPSFLAGYRSACTILGSVKQQFTLFPAQIARFWVLWTHAFSASVMLASVATHSSRSKMAPAALLEIKNACDLFEEAARHGGRAVKFLPILKRLQLKAQNAYREANSGAAPNIPNDIFKPSQPDEAKDELSIFSGKTHTVSTKSAATSSALGSSMSSRAASDSPQQAFTDNPSFANVHPSLITELNTFDGRIKAQIQNAYRAGGEVFGGQQQRLPQAPQMIRIQPQHQQQQQAMYQAQQAQYQQQLDRERLDREREEAERQELERQELARQQQLQQQQEVQRQHEIQRQQLAQQEEILRQQRAQQELLQQQHQQRQLEMQQQQQKQEQYRQQLEIQQQQLQQQQLQYQQQTYEAQPPQSAYALTASSSHSMPPPPLHHQRQPSIPQSQTVAQQSYQLEQTHQQPQHYQSPYQYQPQQPAHIPQPVITPQHTGVSQVTHTVNLQLHYQHSAPSAPPPHAHIPQHTITPQHTGGTQVSSHIVVPQQHSMYAVPPDYAPQTSQESSSSYETVAPPGTMVPSAAYGQPSGQPTSSSYVPDTYKYWPAASASFAMPDQQASSSYAAPAPQYLQHYTPEGALRGIAADDRSLQETWQSYMNKVGSPRQFFDD